MKLFKLPEDLRSKLKKPLGRLVKDEDIYKVKRELSLANIVVTVGDATTERIYELGVKPKIHVIDLKEKRKERVEPKADYEEIITIKNPAGNISASSLRAIKHALKLKGNVRILVIGEEDLLALPLIALLPNNSILAYGQPNEGIVIVNINDEKKRFAKCILKKMGIEDT
jgi:hypothetical protein